MILAYTIEVDGILTVAEVIFFAADAFRRSFGAVVVFVCYEELRRAKEGDDAKTLAAVFS